MLALQRNSTSKQFNTLQVIYGTVYILKSIYYNQMGMIENLTEIALIHILKWNRISLNSALFKISQNGETYIITLVRFKNRAKSL